MSFEKGDFEMDPTKQNPEIKRSDDAPEVSQTDVTPDLRETPSEQEQRKPHLPIENVIDGEDLDEDNLPGSEKPKYIQ